MSEVYGASGPAGTFDGTSLANLDDTEQKQLLGEFAKSCTSVSGSSLRSARHFPSSARCSRSRTRFYKRSYATGSR